MNMEFKKYNSVKNSPQDAPMSGKLLPSSPNAYATCQKYIKSVDRIVFKLKI